MKKMYLCAALTICTASIVASVSAASATEPSTAGKPQILFQQQEIKDKNILFDYAKKGISDLKMEKIKSHGFMKNMGNGKLLEVPVYLTTQHLKEESLADGTLIDTFATTVVSPNISSSYDGNRVDSKWDSSIGVKAFSTIYWNNIYANGTTYYSIVGTDGGWTISDSSEVVSNRSVTMGQTGAYLDSWGGNYQNVTYHPTGNSFSYNAPGPSTWSPVQSNASPAVGETSTCSISSSRGSGSWTLTFTNNIQAN